jgi:hypothetical protein
MCLELTRVFDTSTYIAMYVGESETVIVERIGPHEYAVRGHPQIPVAECHGCGGYRFQYAVYGGCHGPVRAVDSKSRGVDYVESDCFGFVGSCYHREIYRGAKQLARAASRFVKKCSQCGRYYVSGGGRAEDRAENSACPAPECKIACARQYASESNRCEVCGAVCLQCFVVTTDVLPHLYPDRLFVGGDHCLCPGVCFSQFKRQTDRRLHSEVKTLIETTKRKIAKGDAAADDYSMLRQLEDREASTRRSALPVLDEVKDVLVAWSKDRGSLLHVSHGFALEVVQQLIECEFDCALPRALAMSAIASDGSGIRQTSAGIEFRVAFVDHNKNTPKT